VIQGLRLRILGYVVSGVAPLAITIGILALQLGAAASTGYSYLYLGAITLVALAFGLGPAIVVAVLSAVLIDYFFVPPIGTFTIASPADIQNLLLFVIAALVVGILADTRRRQEHHSRDLAESLRQSNIELERRRLEAEEGRRLAMTCSRWLDSSPVSSSCGSNPWTRERLSNPPLTGRATSSLTSSSRSQDGTC
jgi:two-component system sensor histidine kinase KdpD